MACCPDAGMWAAAGRPLEVIRFVVVAIVLPPSRLFPLSVVTS